MEHLLPADNRLSLASGEFQCSPSGALDPEWKAINEFYFKSLASVQLLQHICLKHHEDFTSEQVGHGYITISHYIVCISPVHLDELMGALNHQNCADIFSHGCLHILVYHIVLCRFVGQSLF